MGSDLPQGPGQPFEENRSDLAAEPWHQDLQNPRHIYNNRDEMVAFARSQVDAERIVAAVSAVASLPTELLRTSVIAETFEPLMVLYRKQVADRKLPPSGPRGSIA